MTPEQIHKLADRKGVVWDSGKKGSGTFLAMCRGLTGKAHLDKMSSRELGRVANALKGM